MTLMLFVCNVVSADTVVVQSVTVSAQQAAEQMARTGVLRHCGRAGGRREGIGFSSVSAGAALRACCFSREAERGIYRIVDEGVARGPRGWFAVRRYE
ncbi:MAG: hypothetical protein EBQ89_00400 [Alphaproteobacteria bacterium]|nr:hypothetical protein [Alphaproteobacteria bacterium]